MHITRVSGPVSVHVFDVPNEDGGGTNRLYIFGDEHFSYDHMCDACDRSQGCATIMQFVDEQVGAARDHHAALDVFLEMPYVPARGEQRLHVLRYFDRYFRSNAGPPPKGGTIRNVLMRVFGGSQPSPRYIGQLAQLYKRYHRELYDDSYKRRSADATGVRFHYTDARRDPNVDAILNGKSAARWPVELLRKVLHAFLFSTDFPADIQQALGAEGAAAVVHDTLSTIDRGKRRAVHKVAKQYHNLRDGNMKSALRRYIEDRVDDIVGLISDVIGHNPLDDVLEDNPINSLRSTVRLYREEAFSLAFRYGAILILMDAYLLGRMLRFVAQQVDTTGGSSIVYVGESHAQFYVHFLRDYLGLGPILCNPVRADNPTRCVSLMKTGANTCYVKKHLSKKTDVVEGHKTRKR